MNRRLFSLAGFAIFSGCGGGGSESAPQVTASAAPASAPASAPVVETGPRGDLPAALSGVSLVHPLIVYGDSMAARLAAALGRAVASGVESDALGGSPSIAAYRQAVADPAGEKTAVIWTGHNDYTDPATALANIAATVASIGHSRYVVLTLCFEDMPSQRIGGADRALKEQVNAGIIAAYPGQVIDAPALLATYGNPRNPQDVAALAAGLAPASQREDALHVSPLGADLLARQLILLARGSSW